MFGLNEDDRPHSGHPQKTDDNLAGRQHFTAAYASLNDSTQSAPAPTPPANSVPEEDLLQIKSQAIKSLAPLVSHLEQSPQEKFKTTMMMIQATDNADLLREAYQVANQIQDEGARAQALLDVINEINYFTQQRKN